VGYQEIIHMAKFTTINYLNYTNISSGQFGFMGIQSDGTLWGWGNNSYGQLGTNNQTNYSSPEYK
jgi:alpha-tubulin suppressor-like RCC1 family protein